MLRALVATAGSDGQFVVTILLDRVASPTGNSGHSVGHRSIFVAKLRMHPQPRGVRRYRPHDTLEDMCTVRACGFRIPLRWSGGPTGLLVDHSVAARAERAVQTRADPASAVRQRETATARRSSRTDVEEVPSYDSPSRADDLWAELIQSTETQAAPERRITSAYLSRAGRATRICRVRAPNLRADGSWYGLSSARASRETPPPSAGSACRVGHGVQLPETRSGRSRRGRPALRV